MTGKPRNPGYIAGDNWAICDVCGMAFRQADLKKRWDGAVVCHQDWEVRHPQDFLRARKERISPSGHVRSDPQEAFLLRHAEFSSTKLIDDFHEAFFYHHGEFNSTKLIDDFDEVFLFRQEEPSPTKLIDDSDITLIDRSLAIAGIGIAGFAVAGNDDN